PRPHPSSKPPWARQMPFNPRSAMTYCLYKHQSFRPAPKAERNTPAVVIASCQTPMGSVHFPNGSCRCVIGESMKRILPLAIFMAGALLASDPNLGTWKLNLAKSKFSPGPGPQSVTTTVREGGGWVIAK